jgi:heat shock protein HtpX
MNTLKTVFLMTFMMVLLMYVGSLVGGQQGVITAFVISLVMNFGAYWFSDKIVLMRYRANQVTEADSPKLFSMVNRLASAAQLPMPKVYIIPDATPNAFATGRNPGHASVAVTDGILKLLSDDELEGVIAHELAHVKHRDILTGTIVATLVGTITFVSRMAGYAAMFAGGGRDRRDSGGFGQLILMIVAPIAAVLIQLAISRSREFAADEGSARISGRPLSLANALKKLETGVERIPMQNPSPSSAHMFIMNPLKGSGIMKLFSTHPPIADRIEKLQALAMGGL